VTSTSHLNIGYDFSDRLQVVFGHDEMVTAPGESVFFAPGCQPFRAANREIEQFAAVTVSGTNCQAEGAAEVIGDISGRFRSATSDSIKVCHAVLSLPVA
jgi:hypothetical protein